MKEKYNTPDCHCSLREFDTEHPLLTVAADTVQTYLSANSDGSIVMIGADLSTIDATQTAQSDRHTAEPIRNEDNQVTADFQQGADKCDAPLSSGTLLCQMELCRIDHRKRIPLQELDSDQQKVESRTARKAGTTTTTPSSSSSMFILSAVWWRLLVVLACFTSPVLSYRFYPVCQSVSHTAVVHRRATSWLGVHQSMPRPFQHVQQKPLCAAAAASAGQQTPETGSFGSLVATQWKGQFLFELSPATVDVFSEGISESIPGEHLLVKKLPEAFVIRYGSIPEKIYVRDCYKALYERAAQSRICQQQGCSATLFTGAPGIGKSLFLVYFIYRFLTDARFEDKRFALEFTRGEYVCFRPTGAHGEFWCSNEDGIRMRSKQFLLLCDISEAVEPVSRAKWTYIFSSPAPDRYKEILKNSPCHKYTLPTWSELELLFVNADIARWYDEFVLFGGVPRYIFPDAIDDSSPRELLGEALEVKGGALSESFFKYGFGMADWLQSYMLVHINPPVSVGGEFVYHGKKVYTFASDAIFQWLAEKHSTQMLAGAVRMFNVGVASESYGSVSAGKLFEKVCLWLKPLDGMRLTATSLNDSSQTDFIVPSVRQVLPPNWKKTAQLVPNVLYVPRISNLKSGNCFFLVLLPTGGYMLVVLQITVGKSHPAKVNGLHDILLAYPQDVRAHVVSKALVFVLPAHGELDTEQALTTQKEEQMDSARVPVVVRDFKQFVYRHTI